jgi:CheY-like chemotaxis protein
MAGETVLVIEDNPTNRKLIEIVLRRSAYRLLSAENGELGVEIALRENPDLILMDLQLPVMSGIDATRILRSNPATVKTPIIALTGSEIVEERERALEAGCTGYITKPIDTRAFPEQVRGFLNSKS